MIWVLDTNVVSALLEGDPVVLAALERVSRAKVGVPEPVFAELTYGIERMQPSRRRALLELRYSAIRNELAPMTWTPAVTEAFGRIKAQVERRGVRLEDFDVAIAAHAVATGATLVTANLKHLRRVEGLRCESWSA